MVASKSIAGVARPAAGALPGFSAYDLAGLIRTKQVTAGEVVEETIRNIEALNATLNAVIHKTYDRARQRASAVGDGPFAGVPFLVKDNATIAGIELTQGSRALRGNVPDRTAPFFAAAESSGLIVLGVTNMPELGLLDGTENALYGSTRNPWNPDYSPGGSSGGSAACVAAGLVPLAHGTDGGGSIRIPASHCGLFGLKASRGRLLPGRFNAPPWERMVDGCISRSVRDSATYLALLEDPGTPLPKLGFVSARSSPRLKIALMEEGMRGQAPDPEIRAAIAATAQLCRDLGHTVDAARPPLDQAKLADAARQVANIEVARTVDAIAKAKGITRLESVFESRALAMREEALRNGVFGRQIAAALPVLAAGTAVIDQFLRKWDVLLSPVVRAPVFKIGMRDQAAIPFTVLDQIVDDYVAYTALHNICGTPAMSVPLNWDSKGLPIGSQFSARLGAETTLLALAYEIEEARPWANRRPSIFVT